MTIELVKGFLLRCLIINLALFFFSFGVFSLFRSLICKMHGKWYGLSDERISEIVYSTMAFYKILMIFFLFVPYIVLIIMR